MERLVVKPTILIAFRANMGEFLDIAESRPFRDEPENTVPRDKGEFVFPDLRPKSNP